MGKNKTRAEMAQTFTLGHFVSWVVSAENFKAYDRTCVAQWARQFVHIIKENILQNRSMSFSPIGHLVVASKSQRQLRLPDGQWCESQAGFSVRFRGRPCESGSYIKRADWATLLSGVMSDTAKSIRLFLYDCWVAFLKHAMSSKARIEIRGLGGFHLHQRDSTHTNLAHVKTRATGKVYLRFAPSKKMMNALNKKSDM